MTSKKGRSTPAPRLSDLPRSFVTIVGGTPEWRSAARRARNRIAWRDAASRSVQSLATMAHHR
jgi:hypothetical protein